MVRSALVLTALLSAPAWAVGERISISKGPEFVEQLNETLCVSMDCGGKGIDAVVTAKTVKGKAEIKVTGPGGALKATITAPLNEGGRLGSMDLVAATSGIIQAIEGNAPKAEAAKAEKTEAPAKKKQLASKSKKKSGLKIASKARGSHSRG